MLNLTTNLKGDQGKRWKVSWCERPLSLYLVFNLAWSSCFFLLAVLPGVVMDCQAHVVPLQLVRQDMGDFCQLGEEPRQDGWENRRVR